MAITHRLYRSARLGSGTLSDPYYSALRAYIVADGSGSDFEDWIHETKPVRYALASCEASVHDTIAADVNIQALSPQFSALEDLDAWLDGSLALTAGQRTAVEDDGIPIDDITSSNTRREFLRRVALHHRIGNYMRGLNDSALDFLRESLSTTVSQVPQAVRTRIQTWMQERGLSTAWISGSTTVRQVLKYILVNINLSHNIFVKLHF